MQFKNENCRVTEHKAPPTKLQDLDVRLCERDVFCPRQSRVGACLTEIFGPEESKFVDTVGYSKEGSDMH